MTTAKMAAHLFSMDSGMAELIQQDVSFSGAGNVREELFASTFSIRYLGAD